MILIAHEYVSVGVESETSRWDQLDYLSPAISVLATIVSNNRALVEGTCFVRNLQDNQLLFPCQKRQGVLICTTLWDLNWKHKIFSSPRQYVSQQFNVYN